MDRVPETMFTCGHHAFHDSESDWNSNVMFTPGLDPRGTTLAPPIASEPRQSPQEVPGPRTGSERAHYLMGPSFEDDGVEEGDLRIPDNTRIFEMLPPFSRWDKPKSSTDRQVLSSGDGQDVRRRLRSIQLPMNTASRSFGSCAKA